MSKSHQKDHNNYQQNIQQSCESDTEDSVLSLYLTDMFKKEAVNFHEVLKEHQGERAKKSALSGAAKAKEDFIIDVLKECMPQISHSDDSNHGDEQIKVEKKEDEVQYQYKTVVYSQIQATGTTYVFNVNGYGYPESPNPGNYHDNHNTNCQYKPALDNQSGAKQLKKKGFLVKSFHAVMNVLFPDVGHPYLFIFIVMGVSMSVLFLSYSAIQNKQIVAELKNNPLQSLAEPVYPNTASTINHDGKTELGMMQTESYVLVSPQYYNTHCLLPLSDKDFPQVAGHRYAYNMDTIDSLPVNEINSQSIIADLHDPVINAVSCQGFSHQKVDGDNELFYQGKPVRFVIKSLQDSFD